MMKNVLLFISIVSVHAWELEQATACGANDTEVTVLADTDMAGMAWTPTAVTLANANDVACITVSNNHNAIVFDGNCDDADATTDRTNANKCSAGCGNNGGTCTEVGDKEIRVNEANNTKCVKGGADTFLRITRGTSETTNLCVRCGPHSVDMGNTPMNMHVQITAAAAATTSDSSGLSTGATVAISVAGAGVVLAALRYRSVGDA